MMRTVDRLVFRDAAGKVGLLLAQSAEAGVARDLGDVGDLVGIEARPAERHEAAFLLDSERLSPESILVHVRTLQNECLSKSLK